MYTIGSALVAGVTGFVGAAVARRLIASGATVFGLVRNGSKNLHRLQGLDGLHLLEVTDFSLDELTRTVHSIRPEFVFNLAAYGVLAGQADPSKMVSGNVDLVLNLLQAVAGTGLRRFIHTGSCSEYAPTSEPLLLSENWPIEPTSFYGTAKAASVQLARTLAARLKVPLAVLRPFGIYGPGEAPQRLAPFLIAKLSAGLPADLTPGTQVRDFSFVDDVAHAYLRAAVAPGIGDDGRVFNVCSARPTSIRTVGETVADMMGMPRQLLRWGALPLRPDEPAWIVGDPSRFHAATGWSAQISLRDGLKCMLARYGWRGHATEPAA